MSRHRKQDWRPPPPAARQAQLSIADVVPVAGGGSADADESVPASVATVAEPVTAREPQPAAPVAPPPLFLRCRILERVSAVGRTTDGHRRDHWEPGDTGTFHRIIVESATHCFEVEADG